MKTNIAVFFGGRSVEHEISIISALQAIANIDKEKYDVTPIYIAKDGAMYTSEEYMTIDCFRENKNPESKGQKISLVKENGRTVVSFVKNSLFAKKSIPVDVAFPIVHGTNCEDGSLQGLFELLGIAYVGCDVMSSALGMDKVLFKNVLQSRGIPVLDGVDFTAKEWSLKKDEIVARLEEKLSYPIIIKPSNLGSSVGISKVENKDELIAACDMAFSFAPHILAEHAVTALREINCSVLGDRDDAKASALEEPVMHDKILSYDDKYRSNASKSGSKGMASLGRELPAKLSAEKTAEIQNIAVETFKAIGANGVVRIDFLMDSADNDKVYVNEINTIPGSLSFYLWEATDLKYKDLIDKLVSLAFKRERERKNLMFTINTNILSETSFGTKGAKGSKI